MADPTPTEEQRAEARGIVARAIEAFRAGSENADEYLMAEFAHALAARDARIAALEARVREVEGETIEWGRKCTSLSVVALDMQADRDAAIRRAEEVEVRLEAARDILAESVFGDSHEAESVARGHAPMTLEELATKAATMGRAAMIAHGRAEREATRLRDLVRYQRGPLHDAGLLTDSEYAALAEDHAAVARLEGYDATVKRAEEAERALAGVVADLRERAASWLRDGMLSYVTHDALTEAADAYAAGPALNALTRLLADAERRGLERAADLLLTPEMRAAFVMEGPRCLARAAADIRALAVRPADPSREGRG